MPSTVILSKKGFYFQIRCQKPQNGSPAKRDRAEFVRQAVKDAVREREYEQIREAYLRQPDSAAEADDWSSAEEWKLD